MQGAGRSGVRILVETRHFSPQGQDRDWDPPNLPILVCRRSFPVVQRLGRYFDHSPPSKFGVKNEWSYTLRAFTAWTGKILPFTFTFVPFFIFLPLLTSVSCISSFYTVLQEKNLTFRRFPVGTGFENGSGHLP